MKRILFSFERELKGQNVQLNTDNKNVVFKTVKKYIQVAQIYLVSNHFFFKQAYRGIRN